MADSTWHHERGAIAIAAIAATVAMILFWPRHIAQDTAKLSITSWRAPTDAPPLAAQQPQHDVGDAFAKYLFPPELIMQRQKDIGLRADQRERIRTEVQKVQATFGDAQLRLASESGKLEALLKSPTIDEARVLAQLDAILALERDIKRTRAALLVRIRNVLTDEQRTRLTQLHGAD